MLDFQLCKKMLLELVHFDDVGTAPDSDGELSLAVGSCKAQLINELQKSLVDLIVIHPV